jgi:hypothetical protein
LVVDFAFLLLLLLLLEKQCGQHVVAEQLHEVTGNPWDARKREDKKDMQSVVSKTLTHTWHIRDTHTQATLKREREGEQNQENHQK